MQKEQIKKILIDLITASVVVAVLVIGYYVFFKKNTVSQVVVGSSTEVADQVVLVGSQIANTARSLRDLRSSVEKTSAVLSTPAFTSLQDFSVEVSPEPIGRANPFLPTDWKIVQLSKLNQKTK